MALRSLGVAYYVKADLPAALKELWKSLAIFKQLDDSSGIGKTQSNIGLMFHNQGHYSKAILFYDSSLNLFNLLGDSRALSKVYNNLGNIHMKLKQYEKATTYHRKSLEIDQSVGSEKGQANSYGNLGLIQLALHEYDKAYDLFDKGMKIFAKIGDLRAVAGSYSNFAKVYAGKGQYEKSLEYFKISLNKYEEIGDTRGVIFANFDMYPILNQLNRHDEAIKRCEKAKQLSEEIESVNRLKDACLCLYKTHKELGHSAEALRYYEEVIRLQDSMSLHTADKKMQTIEFEQAMLRDSLEQLAYNQQKELEHQAALRSQTLTRNIALGSGVILLFLTWGIYNRYRKVQVQKKLTDERVDLMLKEAELKVMDAMIEGRDAERKQMSEDLHDELGSKVVALKYTWASIFANGKRSENNATSYEAMDELLDQLSSHVREFVRRKSVVNVSNFGIKDSLDELRDLIHASHKIQLNPIVQESISIDKQTELELYKITLELISNALRYADPSYINVHLSKHSNELILIVEDDGRGFENHKVQRGMGLKNVKMRAERIGGQLKIDTTLGKGTTVILQAVTSR